MTSQKCDVYIGADHGGYELKNQIKVYLAEKGHRAIDLGVFAAGDADYPIIAREVSEKVTENKASKGILICGTGTGMCMTANKTKGIRAANCSDAYCTKMSREHNDANILCLGGRVIETEKAKELVDMFLGTAFSGEERHVRRIGQIEP